MRSIHLTPTRRRCVSEPVTQRRTTYEVGIQHHQLQHEGKESHRVYAGKTASLRPDEYRPHLPGQQEI